LLKKWRIELVIFGVAAIVLALDQWTKRLIVEHLAFQQPWNPIAFLRPIVTLTQVHNTGAAFGIFPGASWLFTAISVLVVVAILVFYRQFAIHHVLVRLSLGLQLGGALGNLVDRLTRGYVVDFIDFHFWPVFNVADSSLFIGVVILAFYLLFHAEDSASEPDKAEAEGA
jgi:signal peptidase II